MLLLNEYYFLLKYAKDLLIYLSAYIFASTITDNWQLELHQQSSSSIQAAEICCLKGGKGVKPLGALVLM